MNTSTAARRPRISLCMIVKDEERFLEGCLLSVRGAVDEIVIADTGSTDGTVAIAERFHARVLTFPWVGDFSAARNAALAQATGEWILYLDADERLQSTPQDLHRWVTAQKNAGAFICWVEGDHFLDGNIIRHRNGYPRLFRNHPKIRFEGRVHEQIAPAIERLGLPTVISDVVIEHLGYGQSQEIVRQKAERNLELLRVQLQDDPANGYVQFQIGNSLDVLERYEEARVELEKSLGQKIDPHIRASAETMLAGIAIRQGESIKALEHARRSLKHAPEQVLGFWFLGIALMNVGKPAEAKQAFERILVLQSDGAEKKARATAHDAVIDEWKIDFHLGHCCEMLDDAESAASWFHRLIKIKSGLQEPWDAFLRVQQKRTNIKAAMEQLTELLKLRPDYAPLYRELARVQWTDGSQTAALSNLARAQELDPVDESIYVLEMEWRLRADGAESIRPVLDKANKFNGLSYPVYRKAVDFCLQSGDVRNALRFLLEMADTIPDRIPDEVRPKLALLAEKLTALEKIS